jgi:hypothetical protein
MDVTFEVRYKAGWYDCHWLTEKRSDEYTSLDKAYERAEILKLCHDLRNDTSKHDELHKIMEDNGLDYVIEFYGVFRVETSTERVDKE